MDWTEKYRPSELSDVCGNDAAIRSVREWGTNWEVDDGAAIFYGPPGIGKTTAAHAVATEHDWDIVELNASETRTKDVVETIAGGAAEMGTIHGGVAGKRLVILDEADNLHGNVDYGGAAAMTDVVKDAKQPVVLIANDFYEMSKILRNTCETIEFEYVDSNTIARFLRDICEEEGVEYENNALKKLARNADGDVRGAVNDLQATALGNEKVVTSDTVHTTTRDRTEDIFPFLDTVFQDGSPKEAQEAAYTVDETPDDLIQWIEENAIEAYTDHEIVDAYESLARSDEWLGRVRETQEYSYWRYATDAMTAGVASSRNGDNSGWKRWGMPSTWRKKGRTRGTRKQRTDIAQQIADSAGVSIATARTELLPRLQELTHHCKPRSLTVQMAAVYDLDESDVAFITGSGEDTNKVEQIVADAQEKRLNQIDVSSTGYNDSSNDRSSRDSGDPQADLSDPFDIDDSVTVDNSDTVNQSGLDEPESDSDADVDSDSDDDSDSVQTTLF